MANISENLQELLKIKNDIKSALIRKNSEPTGGMVTYADAVDAIQADTSDIACLVEFPESMVDIMIMMGDVDITDSVVSGGLGSIDNVTGNLLIKVAEKKLISYNFSGVVSSNTRQYISKGRSYTTTLSFEEGYEWDNVVIMMGGVNITSSVFTSSTGVVSIPDVSDDIEITASVRLKTFQITSNLTHVISNNISTSVQYGSSYSAVLSADTGYDLGTVSVTMGGSPVSVSDGVINIEKVIGDITITADAIIKTFSITNNLAQASSSSSISNIEYGSRYIATITPNEGYGISNVTITMGGVNITSSVYNDRNIDIASVTGDIVVNVTATKLVFNISRTLNNVNINNISNSIEYGESYSATITPDLGYNLGTVSVTMGGNQVSVSDGVINITKVTGDIIINASGVRNTVSVASTLNHMTISNPANEVDYGSSYSATLTADQYYEISSVSVLMGDSDVTAMVYSDRVITIPSVTGNIIITASAVIKSATISTNFTSVNSNNSATSVDYGTRYTAVLSSTKNNWSVNSIQVMMGGSDVSNTVVSDTTIDIPVVTGDIVITAIAGKAKDIGMVVSTDNSILINDGELPAGTYTMKYEDADGNPIANMDDITTFTI